jgi:hypothetical protein
MLTLRTIGTTGDGPSLGTEPYQYEVLGLPVGRDAMIAKGDGVWKILQIRDGKSQGDWAGSFATAEAALDSLTREVADSN